MLPRADRDEATRQDFVAGLLRHMQGSLRPGVKAVYEAPVEQAFVEAEDAAIGLCDGILDIIVA